MSNNKPFFSVVLPTLNRADYLPHAVQSVLNQTFTDFELIVSNNSSTDNTEQIILSFNDPRIRYFKTDAKLPMIEHWEFATGKANGEFITFLGDDDAHSAIYLESLAGVIAEHKSEIVSCRMADYYHGDVFEKYSYRINANSLVTYPFNNELTVYDSKQAIENIFAVAGLCNAEVAESFQSPQLINAAYHRRLFNEIKKRHNKIFADTLSADYFLAVMALNLADKYYYLDSPLSFHGFAPVSTTVSIMNNSQKDASEKNGQSMFQIRNAPLKTFVPINFVADAILLAKSKAGEDMNYIELDYTNYLKKLLALVHSRELSGLNTAEEKKELAEFIEKQDERTIRNLKSDVLHWRTRLKNNLRLKIYGTRVYDLIVKRHSKTPKSRLVIEGSSAGFSNIEECARFAGKDFLEKYSAR